MELDILHDRAASRLQAHELRYTSGRRALVRHLHELAAPATIQDLVAHGGSATSSLYRNLATLEAVGIAHRMTTVDEHNRWELHEQLTDHHHHHLVCRKCGRMADLAVTDEVERALQQAANEAASRSSFTITTHNLEFVGVCDDCEVDA